MTAADSSEGPPAWAGWSPPRRPMWWIPGLLVAATAFVAWLPFAAIYQMNGDPCSPGDACLRRINLATGIWVVACLVSFLLGLSGCLGGRRTKRGVWVALAGFAVLLVGLVGSFWLAATAPK